MGAEHKALDALISAAREGFKLDRSAGLATVMFTDVANSSAIAEAMGDRIWTARIRDHLALVGQVIEFHGGRLVKTLGDGSMSTFPSARSALAAAAELQRRTAAEAKEPPLRARIGLHTGDVIQTEDDFFGGVVNKAARIAASAQPQEVRVSEATRIMVGASDSFSFEDPSETHLRGLPGTHLHHRLNWRAAE